jgi:hypothetical protein
VNTTKKQLTQKTTDELLALISFRALNMRGHTWGTPVKLDADALDDIRTATAVLQARTAPQVNEYGNDTACANCGDEWATLDMFGYCPECAEIGETN